ncbi:hypothetical protein [Methylobacterium sp. Leaf94]|uniref:hypothetical protein n=1 Tax=Methylobacterium sp. Leaf94 TaxID=1736250 RepID=UPI0006F80CD5|nr:hypothetical protein [Methylobacterium sp. Leaf94]
MSDLFGQSPEPAKPKGTQANGYAFPPGTGPEGETCGSCGHLTRIRLASTYSKCGLARARWTGGKATDVLLRSPACRRWEARAKAGDHPFHGPLTATRPGSLDHPFYGPAA